jgi:AcrR family transcriptional regulator
VKAPLSRDAIVEEALRQVMAEGVKGMSLRKVAAALDTGPASLYAYVSDLGELHALVLDRALAKVNVRRTPGANWNAHLSSILESYGQVLSASPGLARLAFGTMAVGPNALRIAEALLAVLAEGGVDSATAAWALDLLTLLVTATAAEHADGLEPAAPNGPVARAIAEASEKSYPHIHAARAHLLSGTPADRFVWALAVFLRGISPSPAKVPPEAGRTTLRRRKGARRGR